MGAGSGHGMGCGGEGWAGWFWVERQKTDVNCVNQLIGGFRWHLQAELFVWIDTLLSAPLLLQQVLHSVAGPGVGGAPWQKRPWQKIGGGGGLYLPQSTTGRRISCTFIHLSCPSTVLTVDTNCCTSASVDILKARTQRWCYFKTRPDLRVEAERTDPQNVIVHFSCSSIDTAQVYGTGILSELTSCRLPHCDMTTFSWLPLLSRNVDRYILKITLANSD